MSTLDSFAANADITELATSLRPYAKMLLDRYDQKGIPMMWREVIHPATSELLIRWGLPEEYREMVGAMLCRELCEEALELKFTPDTQRPKRRQFNLNEDD